MTSMAPRPGDWDRPYWRRKWPWGLFIVLAVIASVMERSHSLVIQTIALPIRLLSLGVVLAMLIPLLNERKRTQREQRMQRSASRMMVGPRIFALALCCFR